jgi:vitamin B12 transporter
MNCFYSFLMVCFFSLSILWGNNQKTFAQGLISEDRVAVDDVVVTATRSEVPLKQAASSVTVIDEERIQEKHLSTVLEVLREVPGLDIVQTGGLGGTTSAFLRGTNSNHTLVLIDGVQVNSATTGAFDFGNLTTENIERIEIVRGPQSTLYGSDAIGGVIQIFTKKGKGANQSSVSFEAGSFLTFRETIGLNGSSEIIDYSFSAERLDSQGFSKANETMGNTEKDGYENTALSSRVGLGLFGNSYLQWMGRYTVSKTDLDGCNPVTFFCPVDDPNFVQHTRNLVSALSLTTPVTEFWEQRLSFSFHLEELEGVDPDTSSSNFKLRTVGDRIDWQNQFALAQAGRFTLGYEYESEAGESQGNFDETLENHAGYALFEFQFAPFILNAGGRFDENNRYGSETTYKIEGAYFLDLTGSKIRAAYGTGFHGPTLSDLFFPNFGNPNLEPEKSRSVEAGIEQGLFGENLKISGTYFNTVVDDLIVFVFDPVTFSGMAENVQEAKMDGLEFEAQVVPFAGFSLFGNYTFTDTKNQDTGAKLARRPKHKANAQLSIFPLKDLRLILDMRYVGERFDDTANTVRLSPYILFNLAGTYHLTPQWEVFGRVENVFDREYEEVAGYGPAGVSGYGGVKVSF